MSSLTISFDAEVSRTGIRIGIAGDVPTGPAIRSEGALEVSLMNRSATFVSLDGGLPTPHPDHLALIAVLAFFPVVDAARAHGNLALAFNWPVSSALQNAIDRPFILEGVVCRSPAGEVSEYTAEIEEIVSFGGGFDSVAASLLFPNAVLVHESPVTVLEGRLEDAVIRSADLFPQPPRIIYTNQRYLFDTYGLPVWTGVFASSLLYRPKTLVAGSVMDSTYLRDGKGYRPFADSRWYEVFAELGVTIRPTSFLSELGNSRLIRDAGLFDAAAYCARVPFNDCGTCIKCLRRRLLRAMNGEAFGDFSPTQAALDELGHRPLKWGHTYGHALTTLGWLPDWMIARLSDVIVELGRDFSFQEYYLESAFTDLGYPDGLQKSIAPTLREAGILPMPENQVAKFEAFSAIGSRVT